MKPTIQQSIAWLLVAVGVITLCQLLWSGVAETANFAPLNEQRGLFYSGFLTTLGISATALVGSIVVGATFCWMRLSSFQALRFLSGMSVEALRGIPFIVIVLLGYFIVADAMRIDSVFWAGALLLSLFHGAYLGELLRGGIQSISRAQHDAADAVGFTPSQKYRYVILPQSLRSIMPGLAGQTADLIKNTSLISFIGLQELTKQGEVINANIYGTFEAYIVIAGGYFILTLPLMLVSRHLENKLQYERPL